MIFLNYQNYKIGSLDYKDNLYVYNSLQDEDLALQDCVGLIDYDLACSINKTSKHLFKFFVNNFIEEIKNRDDILKKINAKELNCYDILEKLSTMKLDKFGFWLSN